MFYNNLEFCAGVLSYFSYLGKFLTIQVFGLSWVCLGGWGLEEMGLGTNSDKFELSMIEVILSNKETHVKSARTIIMMFTSYMPTQIRLFFINHHKYSQSIISDHKSGSSSVTKTGPTM